MPLLRAKGFNVTAVGNPLTSSDADLAAAKRTIAAQNGPTVLAVYVSDGKRLRLAHFQSVSLPV
jgi:hypothetical protein